jgi:hypothetical protein
MGRLLGIGFGIVSVDLRLSEYGGIRDLVS